MSNVCQPLGFEMSGLKPQIEVTSPFTVFRIYMVSNGRQDRFTLWTLPNDPESTRHSWDTTESFPAIQRQSSSIPSITSAGILMGGNLDGEERDSIAVRLSHKKGDPRRCYCLTRLPTR